MLLLRPASRTSIHVASSRAFSSCVAQRVPPRPFLFTPLPTRALLAVSGPDSPKFLQGLVSNDVRKVHQATDERNDRDRVIYAALLQADGRYMSDFFLHSHPDPADPSVPSFLIDHPASQTPHIRSYLKRHVLRSKLKLAKDRETTWQVVQVWRNPDRGRHGSDRDEARERETRAERWLEEHGIGRDPRFIGMGWRGIWQQGQDGDPTDFPSDLFARSTPNHYHLHRLVHSIPEGPLDFPALPLEANLDLMNGVDYRKGCYVGQELTARTKHKGVVRKRGVALRLFREGEETPDSLLPGPEPSLIPSPNLFPVPPPGSSLTLLPPSSTSNPSSTSSSTTTTKPRRPRAPRSSGKLGEALPVVTQSGATVTFAFGSVNLQHLEQSESGPPPIFVVTPPSSETAPSTETSPTSPPDEASATQSDSTLTGPTRTGHEKVGEQGLTQDEHDQGGRWFAKGFVSDWVEFRLEEDEIAKGLRG
ncbi:hypothetical protein JCM10212_000184 [Sporobolomyces blumeae]